MQEKNYRPNVAIIVLAPTYPFECKLLIAQRSDIKGAWQFPQGGIDENESPEDAMFRELKEEIGTNDVEIISQYPQWLSYDFPVNLAKKMKFDGQNQKYFLVRLKPGATININTPKPEFDEYCFVRVDEIEKIVNSFKKGVYMKVLKYFKDKGYL
ncbi:RNA pyrophosphohydrolase [Candidatus Campylobacter infans]|mgnify:FL=1|uniref:RNA pyrophosphohydrolase n=1 Tax=Candidatus Campylobacter infans TaxID=2561898 RepID=A0A7H9CIK2_9BACT|nr:RNA pyrophosphohydrolase [Candidatus Campylobacter infans]QLI05491.1 RNA pyrophosphohydrolase [Candidatus Campylobacter infans]